MKKLRFSENRRRNTYRVLKNLRHLFCQKKMKKGDANLASVTNVKYVKRHLFFCFLYIFHKIGDGYEIQNHTRHLKNENRSFLQFSVFLKCDSSPSSKICLLFLAELRFCIKQVTSMISRCLYVTYQKN